MKVILLKEHHGTIYLDASTLEKMYAACLSVVQARYKLGYWYSDIAIEKIEPPVKPIAPLDFKSQPDYIKFAFTEEIKKYNKNLDDYYSIMDNMNFLKEALKDGEMAYQFLLYRGDYECEGFDIVDVYETYN